MTSDLDGSRPHGTSRPSISQLSSSLDFFVGTFNFDWACIKALQLRNSPVGRHAALNTSNTSTLEPTGFPSANDTCIFSYGTVFSELFTGIFRSDFLGLWYKRQVVFYTRLFEVRVREVSELFSPALGRLVLERIILSSLVNFLPALLPCSSVIALNKAFLVLSSSHVHWFSCRT